MTDFSFVTINVDMPEYVPPEYVPPAENEIFKVVSPSTGDVFEFIQPATIEPDGPDMTDPTFHAYSAPGARLVGWDKDSVFVTNADGSIADLAVPTDPLTADWYMPPTEPDVYRDWLHFNFADYL